MDDCRFCQGFGYFKPDPFDENFLPCPKCNVEAKKPSLQDIEDELFDDDIGFKVSSC